MRRKSTSAVTSFVSGSSALDVVRKSGAKHEIGFGEYNSLITWNVIDTGTCLEGRVPMQTYI